MSKVKNRQFKYKLINYIFLIVLFFAISFGVTMAYSTYSEVIDFSFSETEKLTVININLSKPAKVIPYLKGKEKCITLELDNSYVPEKIKTKVFANRDIKLGYICNSNNNSKKAFAQFYLKRDCLPSFRCVNNKVTLKLSAKEYNKDSKNKSKIYNSLLHPAEEKYAPVFISIEEASFDAVTSKLASQAGIDLRFKGIIPERISIELQSEDPFNALTFIAEKNNMNFYRDGKIWYMEGKG